MANEAYDGAVGQRGLYICSLMCCAVALQKVENGEEHSAKSRTLPFCSPMCTYKTSKCVIQLSAYSCIMYATVHHVCIIYVCLQSVLADPLVVVKPVALFPAYGLVAGVSYFCS